MHNNNVVMKQNWLTYNRHIWKKQKKEENVLIFDEAYVMCFVRNIRNGHLVDIRLGRLTSIKRKNFDVARIVSYVDFFKKMLCISYSSPRFLLRFLPMKEERPIQELNLVFFSSPSLSSSCFTRTDLYKNKRISS